MSPQNPFKNGVPLFSVEIKYGKRKRFPIKGSCYGKIKLSKRIGRWNYCVTSGLTWDETPNNMEKRQTKNKELRYGNEGTEKDFEIMSFRRRKRSTNNNFGLNPRGKFHFQYTSVFPVLLWIFLKLDSRIIMLIVLVTGLVKFCILSQHFLIVIIKIFWRFSSKTCFWWWFIIRKTSALINWFLL